MGFFREEMVSYIKDHSSSKSPSRRVVNLSIRLTPITPLPTCLVFCMHDLYWLIWVDRWSKIYLQCASKPSGTWSFAFKYDVQYAIRSPYPRDKPIILGSSHTTDFNEKEIRKRFLSIGVHFEMHTKIPIKVQLEIMNSQMENEPQKITDSALCFKAKILGNMVIEQLQKKELRGNNNEEFFRQKEDEFKELLHSQDLQ